MNPILSNLLHEFPPAKGIVMMHGKCLTWPTKCGCYGQFFVHANAKLLDIPAVERRVTLDPYQPEMTMMDASFFIRHWAERVSRPTLPGWSNGRDLLPDFRRAILVGEEPTFDNLFVAPYSAQIICHHLHNDVSIRISKQRRLLAVKARTNPAYTGVLFTFDLLPAEPALLEAAVAGEGA